MAIKLNTKWYHIHKINILFYNITYRNIIYKSVPMFRLFDNIVSINCKQSLLCIIFQNAEKAVVVSEHLEINHWRCLKILYIS